MFVRVYVRIRALFSVSSKMELLSLIKKSRLVHLCFAITFFTSGVLINCIQFCCYYSLKYVDKRLYRKINFYLCYSLYSFFVFLGDWWSNSQIFLYIDKEEFDQYYGNEHAFCIMNHSYDIDWLMGWMFCERIRCLGNCKAYAKESAKYVPTLGIAWKFAEFVFLKRNYEEDQKIIPKQISELVDHPDPIWLLLFPEGTRFTAEKHSISTKFAEKNGLPILKHHLTPRTKGFTASLPAMYGKMSAIYDTVITFKYTDESKKPGFSTLLNGVPMEAHMYFKRIPFDQVPRDADKATKFLHDMFERKLSNVKREDKFQLPRRIYPLINVFSWSVAVLTPIGYSMFSLYMNGRYGVLCTVMSVFSSSNSCTMSITLRANYRTHLGSNITFKTQL